MERPAPSIDVERLHCVGGDDDDLGYWAKGHYSEADMRAAVESRYPAEHRHGCAADPHACAYVKAWWRKVPRGRGDTFQFHAAKEGTPGAFRVTALLTEDAVI